MSNHALLRPEFTRSLAAQLLQGTSVNLIGAHGQGRRQTLEDLRQLLPDTLPVQQVDLQRDQIDLNRWLMQFANTASPTLLILHNFHCAHDPDIFKQLAQLKNNKHLTCLYVSEEVLKKLPLDAENILLPPMEV